MPDLVLGSTPDAPVSKKRGMARAIEVVQWMADFASEREQECLRAARPMTAEVFRTQALHYRSVVDVLKRER